MKYPIYTHHTARFLADMDLDDATVEGLLKPPPLTPKPVMRDDGTQALDPYGRPAVAYDREDHIVKLPVAGGEIVLFLIAVNGARRIATVTPELVLANAAGE